MDGSRGRIKETKRGSWMGRKEGCACCLCPVVQAANEITETTNPPRSGMTAADLFCASAETVRKLYRRETNFRALRTHAFSQAAANRVLRHAKSGKGPLFITILPGKVVFAQALWCG